MREFLQASSSCGYSSWAPLAREGDFMAHHPAGAPYRGHWGSMQGLQTLVWQFPLALKGFPTQWVMKSA